MENQGPVLWCSVLNFPPPQYWHPIWALAHVPAASLTVQVLGFIPIKKNETNPGYYLTEEWNYGSALYHGILLSGRKEWTIKTFNNFV